VVWTSAHASGTVKVYLGATEIGSGASGTLSNVAFAPGDNTVTVKNGDGTSLKTQTVTGACDAQATLTGGACVFNSLPSYSDVGLAIWGLCANPRIVTKTGSTWTVAMYVNSTQFTPGDSSCAFINTGFYKTPLADGRILLVGRDSGTPYFFWMNPHTGGVFDYNGVPPEEANAKMTGVGSAGGWTFVQSPNADHPTWGAYAQRSDGWLYSPENISLYFDNAVLVHQGDLFTEGNLLALGVFNH
jgi:hypothetical protein